MRSFIRLLLLVAALAYGAMPVTGMSALAMPVMQMTDHGGDLRQPASVKNTLADVDCPHSGAGKIVADASDHGAKPVKIKGHCAACLTLPANPAFANGGQPARAAEAALPMPQLVSQLAAPLTPPPRA